MSKSHQICLRPVLFGFFKILNETERPTGVGKIYQSHKNYTLHTSPEERNTYRGT